MKACCLPMGALFISETGIKKPARLMLRGFLFCFVIKA